jgi:hypothetical protein
VHYYGVGRGLDGKDDNYLKQQRAAFAQNGYRFPALLRSVLTDPQFYRVVMPEGAAARTANTNTISTRGDER